MRNGSARLFRVALAASLSLSALLYFVWSWRWPLVGDVTVAPLDAAFRPIGPAFVACSRNISTGGICLYSTDRLHLFHQSRAPSDFVYLEIEALDSPPVQAVMKVLRQTRVDRFWEFAGKIWEAKSGLR